VVEANEGAMKTLALAAFAVVISSSTAFSMPLNQASLMAKSSLTTPARIVCEESGVCYRAPGRRPTARWIYGDGAFYGPYEGPRYYGSPARRYKWSFLTPWL
jgi:hypothetical protein